MINIVLWFNDTSTFVGHFVPPPKEREKWNRKDSRGDEREIQRKLSREMQMFCVEVLRPSQPNGVMSRAVRLTNHTFTGQT